MGAAILRGLDVPLIGFDVERAWADEAWLVSRGPRVTGSEAERLSRRQFRGVALLDAVLREDLGLAEAEALDVLRDLVTETGVRFITRTIPFPSRREWRGAGMGDRERFAGQAARRFFNAEIGRVDHGDGFLEVDVKACRFVRLAREIGRPELAPLFCEADSVLFGRPGAPIRLEREGTIANGADRCDFRFVYEDAPSAEPAGPA